MHLRKLIMMSVLSLSGCTSKQPAPPDLSLCPKPEPLPAWVVEASKAPSLTESLGRIISTTPEPSK